MNVQEAAVEVRSALELPQQYYVEVKPRDGAVIVCGPTLAFAILQHNIDRGIHIEIAKQAFGHLVELEEAARNKATNGAKP